jgi:hypothetical protein
MYIVIIHILERTVKKIGMGNRRNPLLSDEVDMGQLILMKMQSPMLQEILRKISPRPSLPKRSKSPSGKGRIVSFIDLLGTLHCRLAKKNGPLQK